MKFDNFKNLDDKQEKCVKMKGFKNIMDLIVLRKLKTLIDCNFFVDYITQDSIG